MSIQVLPPKYSVSEQIGQAVAPALKQGMEQQFQRGKIQDATNSLGNISENTPSYEIVKKLINAYAGIPGGENYIQAILPHLLARSVNQNVYGGGQVADTSPNVGNVQPNPHEVSPGNGGQR